MYTYSNGSFAYMDLTKTANAPQSVGAALGSFATALDLHWVFRASNGDIDQIVFSNGAYSNADLTVKSGAQYAGCLLQ